MRQDPKETTITPWQAEVLSDIFRVLIREVKSEADAEKLFPGELGIDYKNGSLVIRNPYDGKLFSPNSLKHLRPILDKYDYRSNILNADRVGDITFYSRLGQLDKLKVDFTPDSIIRQMRGPGIFFGAIEYANWESLGWPSDSGICVIYKSDEEHVFIRFYDNNTYSTYEGRYNHFKHMFEGWALGGDASGGNYVETIGGGNRTDIRMEPYDLELTDLYVLTVRVTETLFPGAVVSVNGGEDFPIVNRDGEPLSAEIAPNNIIMLVYDKPNRKWVLLESTESALQTAVSITSERLEILRSETDRQFIEYGVRLNNELAKMAKAFDDKLKDVSTSFETTIKELTASYEEKLAQLATAPGNLVTCISNMRMETSNVKVIPIIPEFDGHLDKLIVNYNQTVLRPGLDYIVTDTGIDFTDNITLEQGDEVQFVVLKQNKLH